MQKRITKDLLTYLPAKALPALAAFITVPIYTRLFSPDQFGNYVLAVAAAEFLLLAAIEGFGQGAIRFFSAYQRRSSLPSSSSRDSLILNAPLDTQPVPVQIMRFIL